MADPLPTSSPSSPPKHDETIKETFESIIIAFVLAFVFRAFVVEAFVIPTGSMAPTLMGEHFRAQCPDCGYRFDVGGPFQNVSQVYCPMTGHPVAIPKSLPAAGDRILVHKYIYRFSEPKRWDVVVFKNPTGPKINYIKRLIGLPNESLYLMDGNVYTCVQDESGQPIADQWQIARKTDRPQVQRAVWRPIYYSDYVPIDSTRSRATHSDFAWKQPWQPVQAKAWDMKRQGGRSYYYTGKGSGELRFAFTHWQDNMLKGMYSYNQFHNGLTEPIEDIRLSVTVIPDPDSPSLRLVLSTTGRLGGGPIPIAAAIEPDGRVNAMVGDPESDDFEVFAGPTIEPLSERAATQVELWFVDQQISIWIDGRQVLRKLFDYPLEILKQRPGLGDMRRAKHWPGISIRLEGGAGTLAHVQLDRDLYYGAQGGSLVIARGALLRRGQKWIDHRLDIRADEFFCLGDNSPMSHDGRYWGLSDWARTDPWITQRMFEGDTSRDGLVPRDLMMGRAFFVYWPAMYPLQQRKFGMLPNFGDMRFIH